MAILDDPIAYTASLPTESAGIDSVREQDDSMKEDRVFMKNEEQRNQHLTCCSSFSRTMTAYEVKPILKMAWLIALAGFMQFVVPVITILFAGQLGKRELAATGLAVSFTNISGVSFIIGSSIACDTLCAQAFGAKNYKRVGVLVQRGLIFIGIQSLPICAIWLNADKILLLLGQDPKVVRLAQEFSFYYIPGLLFILAFSVVKQLVTCQGIVMPLVYSSTGAAAVNTLFSYLLTIRAGWGVKGAGISLSVAQFTMFFLLYLIIKCRKFDKEVWQGWSWECLNEWRQFASLSYPSSLAVLVEWSSFEVGTFVLGLIGETELAVQSILMQVTSAVFQIPFAVETAICIRVGNYLGAGSVPRAKAVLRAGWLIQVVLGTLYSIIIVSLKDYIGYVFTSDREVVTMIASVLPVVVAFLVVDGVQAVSLGSIRGLGLQKYAAAINFVNYDVIALPIASVLALKTSLRVKGYWLGMGIGLVSQLLLYLGLIFKINWSFHCKRAQRRAGIRLGSTDRDDVDTEANNGFLLHERNGESNNDDPNPDAESEKENEDTSTREEITQLTVEPEATTTIITKGMLMCRVMIFAVNFLLLVVGITVKVLTVHEIL